jgi:orotidine-5'-phosphate decarboxylase
MSHVMDRLAEVVRRQMTPLCVGLDPRLDWLPRTLTAKHSDRVAACEEFCLRVLEIAAAQVGVVKPQSAFFELLGADGFRILRTVMHRARDLGLFTILDVKRGDISSTAAAYAEAAFDYFVADAVTVSPYLGRDSLDPFLEAARKKGRGLFVLVRTSNSGAGQFQDLCCGGKPLYEHVAEAVASWSKENVGALGFGDVGAVIGATRPEELRQLRRMLPGCWFLVPGYGAQGAAAGDVAGAFGSEGLGAVVNSSRGVVFPFQPADVDWEEKVERAMRRSAAELQVVAKMNRISSEIS